MASLAKLSENKAYMMLLLKTNMMNQQKLTEAKMYFNIEALQKEKTKYSVSQLNEMSAKHNLMFETFSK